MWNLTVFLSLMWAITILYGEWFAYLVPSHWTCAWPHLQRPASSLDGIDKLNNYVRIAVVADPQLMDKTSLGLPPKSLALEIVQFYTDLYMRRAFLSSVLPLNPDAILFLGDYFDGGFVLSDEEWQESLGRLKHIFNLNVLRQNPNIKLYYLTGNHDIGYSALNSRKPEIIERYEREFGGRNFKVRLGKVDFISVDAQTMDGLSEGSLTSATWSFVKNVSQDIDSTPRVLLTHIPLYRPDWTPCGPYRASPIINQRIIRDNRGQEIMYQNYVTEDSTNRILDLIKPALVLSGHDHDQCSVTHTSKHGTVQEVKHINNVLLYVFNDGIFQLIDKLRSMQHTVGTVSWQQGNLYPSFMLLSVSNSTPSDTSDPKDALLTQLCFLPMQTHIYIWYIFLFAMTLVLVFLWPSHEVLILQKASSLMSSIGTLFSLSGLSSAIKEKNEDEICEYEEMWDAEGTMHLIKKTKKAPPSISKEGSSIDRGNLVMRTNIMKQTEPDPNSSSHDVSINVGSDGVGKPIRTSRSKAKMIIWRIIRAFRALIIISSINVPLYVLLVFKDWIDK